MLAVFKDLSLPFAMSTPPSLDLSDRLLMSLEPAAQGPAPCEPGPEFSPSPLPPAPPHLGELGSGRDFLTPPPLEDSLSSLGDRVF